MYAGKLKNKGYLFLINKIKNHPVILSNIFFERLQ